MGAKDSKLIELVKENPNLPIFAWVHWEVVQDEGCDWLGEFNSASVREYANVDPYGYHDQTIVFKDEPEDYEEWLIEDYMYEEHDWTEEQAEIKAKEDIANLDYKKAIFVYVGLPDNI